jgi:diguanylate cyclase (GGDEF)-like protein
MAGDVALADVASVLLSVVREVDVVARYGGEEFSIILPETDAAGAFVVAEKIRETISLYEFEDAGGQRGCHLTCSVGLATYPSHAQDKEALLKLADGALYRAKESGKDRVRSPAPRRPVRLVPRQDDSDSEERIS